jgi:hypothetical protein
MQEMNGIGLNGTSEINGYFKVVCIIDQVFQAVLINFVEKESETAFALVFTEENYGSHKIRIFQKRVRNEQYAGFGTLHIVN